MPGCNSSGVSSSQSPFSLASELRLASLYCHEAAVNQTWICCPRSFSVPAGLRHFLSRRFQRVSASSWRDPNAECLCFEGDWSERRLAGMRTEIFPRYERTSPTSLQYGVLRRLFIVGRRKYADGACHLRQNYRAAHAVIRQQRDYRLDRSAVSS